LALLDELLDAGVELVDEPVAPPALVEVAPALAAVLLAPPPPELLLLPHPAATSATAAVAAIAPSLVRLGRQVSLSTFTFSLSEWVYAGECPSRSPPS
jgi:hypothetical protein